MKNIFIVLLLIVICPAVSAQKKLDVFTANDLLKLLPDKIKDKDAKKEKDKVKESKGLIGVTVRRDYGDKDETISVELINESPSLIAVNNFLDRPTIKNVNQYLVRR